MADRKFRFRLQPELDRSRATLAEAEQAAILGHRAYQLELVAHGQARDRTTAAETLLDDARSNLNESRLTDATIEGIHEQAAWVRASGHCVDRAHSELDEAAVRVRVVEHRRRALRIRLDEAAARVRSLEKVRDQALAKHRKVVDKWREQQVEDDFLIRWRAEPTHPSSRRRLST